jgi:hypothetical protein
MGQGVYSNDLRSRVVAEVAGGTSRRQAARLYRVIQALGWLRLRDQPAGSSSGMGSASKKRCAPQSKTGPEVPRLPEA